MNVIRRAALAAALTIAAPAWGQVAQFNLERLRLDPSAIGSLVLPGGEVLPDSNFRLGATLHYERDPLMGADDGHVRGFGLLSEHDKDLRLVQDRLTAHVTAAVGFGPGVELDAELPIVAYQGDARGLDKGGIAAPWLYLRVGAPKPSDFAAALSLGFSPGWGDQFDFAGNSAYSFLPSLGLNWRFGKQMVIANAGMLLRTAKVDLAGQTMQHEAQAGLGWSMEDGPLRYEVTGRASFEISGRGESAELLGGVRYKLGQAELFGLAGPGFMDLAGTPTFRALVGIAYAGGPSAAPAPAPAPAPVAAAPAPAPKPAPAPVVAKVDPCAPGQKHTPEQCPALDDDGDGIPNGEDACPLEKGPRETKGCPPKDSDGDGIPDYLDKCPNQPGVPEEQGCPPKRAQVNVETGKIEINEKVYFDTGKSTIQARSTKLLDEVASLLVANKGIAKVVVEGHTDNTGPADFNRKLSQERADAVKGYLVGKGVTAERLEAKGFGPDQPLQPNTTAAGRDANRRVEFTIQK